MLTSFTGADSSDKCVLINCCRSWPPVAIVHTPLTTHTHTNIPKLVLHTHTHRSMCTHVARYPWRISSSWALFFIKIRNWCSAERSAVRDSQVNGRRETHSGRADRAWTSVSRERRARAKGGQMDEEDN